MSLGPLMIDIAGYELTTQERETLQDPLVGGVILFSRNFQSTAQLCHLIDDIHHIKTPHLLIAVDHEGGRVQRFREGFTSLPPASSYGKLYDEDNQAALEIAESAGWLMAAELRVCGIDFSFAPVLDLNRGVSKVIGDRGFHKNPQVVAELARAFMRGMKKAGMAAVGKHYPGHGSVIPDSHVDLPIDNRKFADIQADDLIAFERLIHYGIPALMPAHVVYSDVDDKPAGFSQRWLQQVLRQQLDFQGAIFSDDISMAGAQQFAESHTERVEMALQAGCDMVLVCNQPDAVTEILSSLHGYADPVAHSRLIRMHGRHEYDFKRLKSSKAWQKAKHNIDRLGFEPELALGDDTIV